MSVADDGAAPVAATRNPNRIRRRVLMKPDGGWPAELPGLGKCLFVTGGLGKPGAVAGRLVMCGLGMTAPMRRSVKGRLMNGLIARGATAAAGITLLAAGGALPAAAQPAESHAASAARTWLTAVAASSARAALAVGYGGNGTLALRWNGRSWGRAPSASPSPNAIFYGVAATSARQAWAVGNFSRGLGGQQILIERWNGRSWRRTPAPGVPGGGGLFAVTATSARNAWAVGEAGDPDNGYTKTLILHWNGTAWKKVPSPGNARGASAELLGVAAVSDHDAWAVGDAGAGSQNLVLHWNGTSWKKVPSPSFAHGSVLTGVAAASRAVWAVGTVIGTPYQTLILRWNGSRWVRVRSPSPAAAGGSQLYAVAATGKIVWAVGYAGRKTLIERWNGTAWTRVTSPSPPGADDLAGVTAISARDAWAVGQGHGQTLIVHWNGSAWRRQAS
jgi:hypothetical protein